MRYSGKLGIAQQTEVSPGVWDEIITEQEAIGDLVQRTEALDQADSVLPRYRTTTSVSVLASGIGPVDHSNIRYVMHGEKRWEVSTITEQFPRLVIYFGEEYHGPIPDGASGPSEGP